jgi:hypothetical protein
MLAQEVKLLNCIREVRGSNLVQTRTIIVGYFLLYSGQCRDRT